MKPNVPLERPVRPDCYDFGMDFMGDPEETEIRAYVEALERWADAAVAAERERCCRVVVVQRDDRLWEVARRTILAIRAGDDYVGDVDDEGLLRA